MSKEDFSLSTPFWQYRTYKKDEYFNNFGSVCTHAGLVIDGVFRSYIIAEKTGDEKNIFFYPPNYVLVASERTPPRRASLSKHLQKQKLIPSIVYVCNLRALLRNRQGLQNILNYRYS